MKLPIPFAAGVPGPLRNGLLNRLPLPLRNRLVRLRRRPMYEAFRRAGVLFIHVPRSAGTSISAAVYDHWVNHFTLREQLRTAPADVLALPRFAIVRNPWERAVSSWSYALSGGGKDPAVVLHHPERYTCAEFGTFERFVEEWLPAQRADDLASIFRPQLDYLIDPAGMVAIDHVGRLESIGATTRWLADLTGRPLELPHLNTSAHGEYRGYYTPGLRDRIAAHYAQDIARFGYDF